MNTCDNYLDSLHFRLYLKSRVILPEVELLVNSPNAMIKDCLFDDNDLA